MSKGPEWSSWKA